MVGDSYIARQHGIQYCQAGDPFVGENECACFKCENARLKSTIEGLQRFKTDAKKTFLDQAIIIGEQNKAIEGLKNALRPFAKMADIHHQFAGVERADTFMTTVSLGDLRRAKQALSTSEGRDDSTQPIETSGDGQ